jgi:hypothetical protein
MHYLGHLKFVILSILLFVILSATRDLIRMPRSFVALTLPIHWPQRASTREKPIVTRRGECGAGWLGGPYGRPLQTALKCLLHNESAISIHHEQSQMHPANPINRLRNYN